MQAGSIVLLSLRAWQAPHCLTCRRLPPADTTESLNVRSTNACMGCGKRPSGFSCQHVRPSSLMASHASQQKAMFNHIQQSSHIGLFAIEKPVCVYSGSSSLTSWASSAVCMCCLVSACAWGQPQRDRVGIATEAASWCGTLLIQQGILHAGRDCTRSMLVVHVPLRRCQKARMP